MNSLLVPVLAPGFGRGVTFPYSHRSLLEDINSLLCMNYVDWQWTQQQSIGPICCTRASFAGSSGCTPSDLIFGQSFKLQGTGTAYA